ncbi:hypothetical protein [Bifidobacterium asteroides]|uniref:hypothetical protein n=2 Tax=Bifidobacterium TaxID=1678 RepID=UPI001E6351A8|nr:hypothetical protein [Bifidobacterium asteroides]
MMKLIMMSVHLVRAIGVFISKPIPRGAEAIGLLLVGTIDQLAVKGRDGWNEKVVA